MISTATQLSIETPIYTHESHPAELNDPSGRLYPIYQRKSDAISEDIDFANAFFNPNQWEQISIAAFIDLTNPEPQELNLLHEDYITVQANNISYQRYQYLEKTPPLWGIST